MRPKIKISDYTYNLPENRIAKYPLEKRDDSKILIFKNSLITENKFSNLIELLPKDSIMVFNNTKVVPARLLFRKSTGAIIEIFCLEPIDPSEYAMSFASKNSCSWNVVIGNAKRWKNGALDFFCDENHIDAYKIHLRAELIKKGSDNSSIVKFSWDTGISFSEVLDICGKIPIPPYLKRDTESLDLERYQTLYAKIKGSVAAPTAGLHFTDKVLKEIKHKGVPMENICLHVGAGTFVPVKSEYVSEHKMHTEPFSVSKEFIQHLYNSINDKKVIAVGTTSMRCLESLYYIGCHCANGEEPGSVSQWEPYENNNDISAKKAIGSILDYLNGNNMDFLIARTAIIIVPGYKFKIVDILITNFHQPQSTLLLLIGAFIGDKWHEIYDYALSHDYRFLSYGDSSILFR